MVAGFITIWVREAFFAILLLFSAVCLFFALASNQKLQKYTFASLAVLPALYYFGQYISAIYEIKHRQEEIIAMPRHILIDSDPKKLIVNLDLDSRFIFEVLRDEKIDIVYELNNFDGVTANKNLKDVGAYDIFGKEVEDSVIDAIVFTLRPNPTCKKVDLVNPDRYHEPWEKCVVVEDRKFIPKVDSVNSLMLWHKRTNALASQIPYFNIELRLRTETSNELVAYTEIPHIYSEQFQRCPIFYQYCLPALDDADNREIVFLRKAQQRS